MGQVLERDLIVDEDKEYAVFLLTLSSATKRKRKWSFLSIARKNVPVQVKWSILNWDKNVRYKFWWVKNWERERESHKCCFNAFSSSLNCDVQTDWTWIERLSDWTYYFVIKTFNTHQNLSDFLFFQLTLINMGNFQINMCQMNYFEIQSFKNFPKGAKTNTVLTRFQTFQNLSIAICTFSKRRHVSTLVVKLPYLFCCFHLQKLGSF